MSITQAAIERNRVTWVALAVLLLAGYASYQEMSRAEDPGFTIRVATVVTIFPGASPERVEQLITDPLEEAIQEISELDFMTSQSKTGASVIFVNIKESEKVMRPIWDQLRRKVERVAPSLPDGIIGPTVNDEFGDVFPVVMTITGEGLSDAELEGIGDEIRNEFLLLDEVAKVQIHGIQHQRIYVEYSPSRLASIGLSPAQLQAQLGERNIIIPGGSVSTGTERLALEPTGNFDSIEDLERTLIAIPGQSKAMTLGDIADLRRGIEDPSRGMVRAGGERALAIALSMPSGGDVLGLGRAVRSLISELELAYPIGVDFDLVAFQPDIVEKKVNDFASNLGQAVLIVLIVMMLFLGFRTGALIASLIPSTIVITFFFMGLLGIGIDQVSLASLIIALGMLVDNAIVMSESIMVEMASGKSAVRSAVDSANELRTSLLISSLTTSAAFLPIFLAESATGEYTASIFKVVTIALLSSWVLALTLIPMLCVSFLKVEESKDEHGRWTEVYGAILGSVLRHRAISSLVVLGVFVGGMSLFQFVPAMFFPPNDTPMLTAEIRLPIGSPIERTAETVAAIETFIEARLMASSSNEGVKSWAAFIGEGAPRFRVTFSPEPTAPEYAVFLIATSSGAVVPSLIVALREFCDEELPNAVATIRALANGPPVTQPIEIRLSGRDSDELARIVAETAEALEVIPGARDVENNWGRRTKKLVVNVDRNRAQKAGVTNQDVAISLQTVLTGLEIASFREGEDVIPVTLRSREAEGHSLDKIESLEVFALATGHSVPLKQVAEVEVAWEPAKILRRNRLRTVTIGANLEPGFNTVGVLRQLTPWLEEIDDGWSVGTSWAYGGEIEASVQANEAIAVKLPIAGLIIVLLLVLQFNSLRKPLIILAVIPLGAVGVVLGLLITGSYFGFMTLLGLISLAGIVINNAIVLIDRIDVERAAGLPAGEAIIRAAQRRMRPILLTTCTTVGGLLPLWLGGGLMWEPMAIALIFGLVFATLLTLGVVPLLYAIAFRVQQGQVATE